MKPLDMTTANGKRVKNFNLPVCFHRIERSFTKVITAGKVVWRLSIASIRSPQTRVRAHKSGIILKNIITVAIMLIRRSDIKRFSFLPIVLGHRPNISKLNLCSSTLHTKSDEILNLKEIARECL